MKSGGKEMKKTRIKKPIIRKPMAKEMRKKARERARARTIEKNQILQISRDYSVISDFDHHDPKINTSSCFETGEESGATTQISYNFNPPAMEVEDHHQPMSSQFGSDYQNSLEIMGNWSPSDSTFNFLHQTSTLDLQVQEQELGDSQFFG
ncbi:uncharacterized protein LOC111009036 [Momordica charantia]|uniref:Uncharacterized protein LOC111009036 n=1 Tax=Momordica charantia TaxID=3673 RepID=A0A6J1C779_MOMCH|nr:uncharacterized protein LOC111009036 [Momordica charantia]